MTTPATTVRLLLAGIPVTAKDRQEAARAFATLEHEEYMSEISTDHVDAFQEACRQFFRPRS